MSPFNAYQTPVPNLLYSPQFFERLDFRMANEIVLPTIAPVGALSGWTFDVGVPRSASAISVDENEVIPSLEDLLPITKAVEGAFKEGKRSVIATMTVSGKELPQQWHFMKIRLFVLINNNSSYIRLAKQAFLRLSSSGMLAGAWIEKLASCRIHTPICGLEIARFPLFKLGRLIGEDWLEEDIVNALLEILSLKSHIVSAQDADHRPDVILPTLFGNEAKYLLSASSPTVHRQNSAPFNKNLVALRHQLQKTQPRRIHLVSCDENHFSVQTYDTATGCLEHRDSMHRGVPLHVIPIFKTIVDGLGLPEPVEVTPIAVPLQVLSHGSCGVAALNFVEHQISPKACQWTDSSSTYHRNVALRNLALYHLVSMDHIHDQQTWSIERFDAWDTMNDGLVDNPWASGYNDFNLQVPTNCHPIHAFIKVLPFEPFQEITYREDTPQFHGSASVQSHAVSAAVKVKDENVESDIELFSPPPSLLFALKSSAKLGSSMSAKSDPIKRTNTRIIDLTTPSPSPPTIKIEHDLVLDLTAPPPIASERNCGKFIDLTTPTPTPSPDPKLSSRKRKRTSSTASPTSDSGVHIHSSQQKAPDALGTIINVGTVYHTLEEAKTTIYAVEEGLGFMWRMAQSKKASNGTRKKVTLRCRCYGTHTPTHLDSIDPSDHREGKSIKTGCTARVNLNRIASGQWNVTLVDFTHNHPRVLARNGHAPHPPTSDQRDTVKQLVSIPGSTFNRTQISGVLARQYPEHPLEPRQVSNLINDAKREARAEVERLGGDVATILARLQELKAEDPNWQFEIQLDSNQRLVGLWWQSPEQVALSRRFPDLILTDDTYSRNQYGYPLNLGLCIDGFGHSRILWFCVHETEDIEAFTWIFQNHLRTTSSPPEVLFSDRHASIIRACEITMPLTFHAFCLHHLNGNLATNLRPAVGARWIDFNSDFWTVYRSPSPECFEEGWNALVSKYPSAKCYLADLYHCRDRWAWAWIGTVFTGGIRTNGRVEVENRISKALTGPKSTFFQVFLALNGRSSLQGVNEMTEIRKSSRRQHDQPVELVFAGPLRLLREHAGPFALQSTFKEMKKSVFYNVEVIQLPPGMKSWNDSALLLIDTPAFSWLNNEESKMINAFENDGAYVSMRWILRLLHRRQLYPSHILKIAHIAARSHHYLAILPDNRYMCDCCMGVNLGVPCRHYLKAWTVIRGLGFHMGLVRARWFKNPNLDLSTLPISVFDHAAGTREELPGTKVIPIPSILLSNPLERRNIAQRSSPPPSTQTVGAREVNHEANAILRPILAHVRTQEQLEDVLSDLRNLKRIRLEAESEGTVLDPQVLNPKGRPRTSRITGALEGRARGGGPVTRLRVAQDTANRDSNASPEQETAMGGRRCGICREQGHNRTRCPIALSRT